MQANDFEPCYKPWSRVAFALALNCSSRSIRATKMDFVVLFGCTRVRSANSVCNRRSNAKFVRCSTEFRSGCASIRPRLGSVVRACHSTLESENWKSRVMVHKMSTYRLNNAIFLSEKNNKEVVLSFLLILIAIFGQMRFSFGTQYRP